MPIPATWSPPLLSVMRIVVALVFFSHGKGNIYHVGIYLKDGKFAHSATNGGVMVSSLNQAYYSRNFYAAGRVEGTEVPQAEALLEAATAQVTN